MLLYAYLIDHGTNNGINKRGCCFFIHITYKTFPKNRELGFKYVVAVQLKLSNVDSRLGGWRLAGIRLIKEANTNDKWVIYIQYSV